MDRTEKIDAIVELLDDNSVKIIDTSRIQALVIDVEWDINDKYDKYLQDDIKEKGLVDGDIDKFKKFLEEHQLMLISYDDVQGVSFENVEYDTDELYGTSLFEDQEDEEDLLDVVKDDESPEVEETDKVHSSLGPDK